MAVCQAHFGRRGPRPSAQPTWPPYWVGLFVCLAAPTILTQILALLSDLVALLAWSSLPWGQFHSTPTVGETALRELQERHPSRWLAAMIPAATCALVWSLAHVRSKELPSPLALLAWAVSLPALVALFVPPIYALQTDPNARKTLEWAFTLLRASIHMPQAIGLAFWLFVDFITQSYSRVASALARNASLPYLGSIPYYLSYLALAWICAWFTREYAVSRGVTSTLDVLSALGRSIASAAERSVAAVLRLAGVVETTQPSPARTVARAVAAPWLVPAACTFLFIAMNGVLNLFPVVMALVALAAYGVTLLLWRLAAAVHLTDSRFGAAMVGGLSAILVAFFCVPIFAQSWAFRLLAGPQAHLPVLVSMLPVNLAFIASVYRGVRSGLRSA